MLNDIRTLFPKLAQHSPNKKALYLLGQLSHKMKIKMTFSTLIILVLIGVLTGIFSGLLGVGGGLIMVPMFVYFLGFSQHHAQGMSLAVMLPPVTFLAVFNYHRAGAIDWKMALMVSLLFILGGYFGSKMALRIDQASLKKLFGVILLIAGIKMMMGK